MIHSGPWWKETQVELNSIFVSTHLAKKKQIKKGEQKKLSIKLINKLFHVIPLVPDVNGTKLIHQQWNPPPLCTEFTKVSLRVEARHDIKRSTLKNIANLSTWLHPRKRAWFTWTYPLGKGETSTKPSVFWGSSRSFFGGWNLQAPCFGRTRVVQKTKQPLYPLGNLFLPVDVLHLNL